MLKSLFVYGVLAAVVLLIPSQCEQITVCIEDDNDLRVECRVTPEESKYDSYEFSWSHGTREILISTNVSGSSAEKEFEGSYVEEIKPHGYKMTLPGYTDKLPHNTTYICKISGTSARVNLERDQLQPCSAVSLFLKSSCSWIVCLLLFFYQTQT